MLTAIDGMILDRIYQPIADRAGSCFQAARFCADGYLVSLFVYDMVSDDGFSLLSLFFLGILCSTALNARFRLIPKAEKDNRNGMFNKYRIIFLPMRLTWLGLLCVSAVWLGSTRTLAQGCWLFSWFLYGSIFYFVSCKTGMKQFKRSKYFAWSAT